MPLKQEELNEFASVLRKALTKRTDDKPDDITYCVVHGATYGEPLFISKSYTECLGRAVRFIWEGNDFNGYTRHGEYVLSSGSYDTYIIYKFVNGERCKAHDDEIRRILVKSLLAISDKNSI